MQKNVLFVGIDVDNKAYHVSVYEPLSDESFEFKCGPSASLLIKAFKKHNLASSDLRLCYEATYIGFSLYRQLSMQGFCCQIAAPSLIPVQPGIKQKTDRIDCRKLARFYCKGLLTFIYVPDEKDEATHSKTEPPATQKNCRLSPLCHRPLPSAIFKGMERAARVSWLTIAFWPIKFSVINSETVNAFALPDGNVVVFTGIIDLMDDYDELAGLIGHEVAHVNNRHSMRMMCRNLAGYIFLSAVLSDVNGNKLSQ